MSSSPDAKLDRQEQIWTGLYGPTRARALIEMARGVLARDPDSSIESILNDLDPEDDFDIEEAGTMRPI